MILSAYSEDLQLLARALRVKAFRFIIIGHNRPIMYMEVANWLHKELPDRSIFELRLEGKGYRDISNRLNHHERDIVLIPDLDQLFLEKNQAACVAFNQRRDFFARRKLALVCFVQPGSFAKIPEKLPDLWSLRSLDLDFYISDEEPSQMEALPSSVTSTLGGSTLQEKKLEIEYLLRQLEQADSIVLQCSLNNQLGKLYFELSEYETALSYLEKSLELAQKAGDRKTEGDVLNNIAGIYMARGDYGTALRYLERSLKIQQEIGDRSGMCATLHNMAHIALQDKKIELFFEYEMKAYKIAMEIKDATALFHIGRDLGVNLCQSGQKEEGLPMLQRSYEIGRQSGIQGTDQIAQYIQQYSQNE